MLLPLVMMQVFSTSSDSIGQVWREKKQNETKGVTSENQQGFYDCPKYKAV